LDAVQKRGILTLAVPHRRLSLQSSCRGSSNLGVAALHFSPLKDFVPDTLLPGITITTSATDFF
jgi:hypothetical protein